VTGRSQLLYCETVVTVHLSDGIELLVLKGEFAVHVTVCKRFRKCFYLARDDGGQASKQRTGIKNHLWLVAVVATSMTPVNLLQHCIVCKRTKLNCY
jgi:hypothetical protein